MHLKDIINDNNRLFMEDRIPEEYKTDYFYHTVADMHAVALPINTDEVIGLVKYPFKRIFLLL